MKRHALITAVALVCLALPGGVAGQDATYEGTLVDSKCYLSDKSQTTNDHGGMKDCGAMCLKGGTPAAVVTKSGTFHALIAPSLPLAPYVGQQVRVSGSLHNGAVLAKKVEVQRSGKWEEVKLAGMM